MQSQIERQGHGETLADVVDEQGEEDGHSEGRTSVVGGVGNKAFGQFVESNSEGGLKAYRQERILGDVVMVLLRLLLIITFNFLWWFSAIV